MNGHRIVLVTRRYWPLVGDSERAISDLADGLRLLGALPTVVTARFDADWPTKVVCREVLVHRVDFPRQFGWSTRRYVTALAGWLRANGSQFDLACVSHIRQDAFAAINAFRDTGVPVVLRAEADVENDLATLNRSGRFGQRVLRHCLDAQAVVTNDRQSRRALITAGFAADRVHCIPNGVPELAIPDEPLRQARRAALSDVNQDLQARRGVKVALYVGSLHASNHLSSLLQAWKQVAADWPASRLWLIGDGTQRDKLYQQIRDLELLGRILLPGTFDNLEELFQAADLYIQPHEFSTLPLPLLQAMAAGLPVVVCGETKHRSVIVDGETGHIAPTADALALARAITQTFRNPMKSHRMAQAAARRVRKQHSLSKMGTDHLTLFQQLISHRSVHVASHAAEDRS